MDVEHADYGEQRPITALFDELLARAFQDEDDVTEDAVMAKLDSLRQDVSAAIVADLLQSAPERARELTEVDHTFERSLEDVWGQALDLFTVVRGYCLETGGEYYVRHWRQAHDQGDAKFEALVLLHGRACLVASEIHALLRTGHAAGAQSRWRTLHELAVVAAVLGEADRDVSERFLQHQFIEQYKDAAQYQEHCLSLGQPPYTDAEMAAFRETYDELVAKYGQPYKQDWGWAVPILANNPRPTFVALEQLAGMQHVRPWYRFANHGVHSGSTGTVHIRDLYGRGQGILVGSDDHGLAEPGCSALISLGQVTAILLLCGIDGIADIDDIVITIALRDLVKATEREFLAADEIVSARHNAERPENDEIDEDPKDSMTGTSDAPVVSPAGDGAAIPASKDAA